MLKTIFADFIRMLQPPTPLELAEEELMHAKRELLKAQSAQEYAHHMANYHEERINRLALFINQQETLCQSSPSPCGTAAPAPIQLSRTSTSNSGATSKKSWR
jgi:uncharacterized protein YbbK (DUF523 family)